MTEESSADEENGEPADEPEEPGDGMEDLAPARSDEEPDVEAAKEALEAVGREEGEDEDDENEGADEIEVDEHAEVGQGDEPADDGSDDEGPETADEPDEDEPNPEDLVRDPDEPQVTSSLEEAEAADAEAEAAEAEAAEAEAEATEAEAEATEAEAEATEAEAEATEAEAEAEPVAAPDADAGEAEGEKSVDDADETGDDAVDEPADDDQPETDEQAHQPGVPEDVRKYDRFKKVDGSQYDRVNEFLRDRTYITAREWAIARLCSDFRTETGVEMTKIGENLPELVPFMTDTYTPQAVNQARASFEDKVRTAGATFLYGAMCDFFTAEELDDVMYEATEVAKFLLEVEGVELSVEDELEAEDRISAVMREVRSSSAELRHERCPECGAELSGGE
jgi:hypothetical protein